MKLMTSTWKSTVVALLLAAAGCAESPSVPLAPAPAIPVTPPAPPPSGPAAASLAVEDPFVLVTGGGATYVYGVRFLLRETSGRSGATIERIVIRGPAESDETGSTCWRTAVRVPPGGTLDTFYTDAGADWLLYCSPFNVGHTPAPALGVEITFHDDRGNVGSVTAAITRIR